MKSFRIKRAIRFFWQRHTRGWDDSDTWSLDWTLAHWLLPRLKRFKELNDGFPHPFTEEEWDGVLDKMIKAFEIIVGAECWDGDMDMNEVNEGLDLFRKHFIDLWW